MTNKVPIMLPNTTAFHLGSSMVCAKPTYVAKPPMGSVSAHDPTGGVHPGFPERISVLEIFVRNIMYSQIIPQCFVDICAVWQHMAFDIYAIRDDTCNVTFDYRRCGQ